MKTRLLACAGIATLLLIGSAVGGAIVAARRAEASRNSSGSYTLYSPGNPAVTNQLISTSLWNNTFGDVATELSDSLSRSGKGGMTAPLRTADGVVGTPSWSWTSETGSGYYRIGAGDLGLSILGTKTGEWTANGLRVADGALATPSLSFFNDSGSGFYRIGSNDIGFAINGTKKLEWTASLFTVTPNTTISGVASFGGALPTTSNTTPFSVIGAGPLFAVESRSGVNTRIASNEYFDGATDKYNATGFAGILQLAGLTSADYIFYTAPSGTAGNTPTFTERLKVNESGVTIGASGTAVTQFNYGSCTLDNATPSKCTATVVAGAKCTANTTGTTSAKAAITLAVSVTSTTLTITASTGVLTDVVNYICAG